MARPKERHVGALAAPGWYLVAHDGTPADLDRRATFHRLADALSAREPALWALAVGALLLDLGLTVAGLGLGLEEQNLFVVRLLETTGPAGLGFVKTAALAVGLVARSFLPRRYVFIVPMGLAVPWLVAAAVNVVVIAATVDPGLVAGAG